MCLGPPAVVVLNLQLPLPWNSQDQNRGGSFPWFLERSSFAQKGTGQVLVSNFYPPNAALLVF
jgi:hypothetical protein